MRKLKLAERKNLALFFGAIAFTAAITVTGLSWRYSASLLYVAKALARETALETIEFAVKLYDPTRQLSPKTGVSPLELGCGRSKTAEKQFAQLAAALSPDRSIKVMAYDNEPITCGKYKFGYQTANDPELVRLKEKYGIEKLVSSSQNDFEQLLSIADWVNRQWLHGTSGSFDPRYFNADKILEQANNGARFWCNIYAMTFIQMAASVGYQGRLVALSSDGYSRDHAVVEVWSNHYRKWIALDIDFNIWYAKEGVPLSALEIHNAWMNGGKGSLEIVRGKNRPIPELEGRIPTLFKYYAYFDVDMRNDWLTNRYFPGHPARSDEATLWWEDKSLPRVLHFKTRVNNPGELYWDLNRTYMSFGAAPNSARAVRVRLETVTPNFEHFEISVDGRRAVRLDSDQFRWTLHEGENSIEVQSVNSFGQRGIPSRVAVLVTQNHKTTDYC